MTRYWVMAPYDATQSEVFEKVWNYDLEHGTIAIGWGLGDISGLGRQEFELKFRAVYDEKTKSGMNQLWRFHHEISPGDTIVARQGTKKVLSVGIVSGSAFF